MKQYTEAIFIMEMGTRQAINYLENEDLTSVDYNKVKEAWSSLMLALSMEPDCTKFWQDMNNKGE